MPISSPPSTRSRSAWESPSIASRSLDSAGLPASSPMMCPSAAVIVSSGPIGAAPCETHGSTSMPSRRTPTAPPSTTSSPKNSAGPLSAVRAEATPPSSGSSGVASERKRRTASVGNENGSASRIAPAAPSRSGRPDSAPEPSSISSTVAWNGTTSPSPRQAAHTETAVPASISRASLITPPAPQPTSVAGASISCTAASVSSGAARCAPEANITTRSQGRSPSPRAAAEAASSAPARASGVVERPVAMCTLTRLTILRHMEPPPRVVAIFGPTGVGKTEVAVALAERLRDTGEDPVAISADALQVYEGLEILTGAASPAQRARLEHRLLGYVPVTEPYSAGAYAERAHAEIDAALAAGRRPLVVGGTGLYLRAALADLDLRPPPPPRSRERWQAELDARGPEALHAALAQRAPATAARVAATDARRVLRALELLDAGAEPPPPPGAPSQLWTAETRHPTLLAGLVMDRGALAERIERRVDAMLAAGALEEVRRADARGASATARKALGFGELLAGDAEAMRARTRRYAKRQLTWMRKLPGVRLLDVTDRDPSDVAAELHAMIRGA